MQEQWVCMVWQWEMYWIIFLLVILVQILYTNTESICKKYFEASASSMFTYALLKEARKGYLPKSMIPICKKGV